VIEEGRHTPAQASEVRAWLTALLGVLIVLLLVVANVQLNEGGSGSENGHVHQGNGTASTLPAPVQGTSNKVLSEELNGVSTSLSRPVDLLRQEMAPLAGLTEGQTKLSESFGNVATSVRGLSSLRVQLRKMNGGLGAVVGNTKAMAGNLHTTASTLEAVEQGIGSTSRSTNGMVALMSTLNQSITNSGKSTNESIVKMDEGIEGMRRSFTEINQSLAATSAGTQEMKASMITLNANMERFLKLFCTVLTSETECPKESG
jgi:uncharacterized phage infection (PIP) family protein YhgE